MGTRTFAIKVLSKGWQYGRVLRARLGNAKCLSAGCASLPTPAFAALSVHCTTRLVHFVRRRLASCIDKRPVSAPSATACPNRPLPDHHHSSATSAALPGPPPTGFTSGVEGLPAYDPWGAGAVIPVLPACCAFSRRRDCHSAAPPSIFSRCFNSDGERASPK